MGLNNGQTKAFDAINAFAKQNDNQIFTLGGYAGTGKTYLLQELIQSGDHEFTCCAPTGKAASVLQKKLTNQEVSTIHSLVYKVADKTEQLKFFEEQLLKMTDETEKKKMQEKIAEEKEKIKNQGLVFERKDVSINPDSIIIVDEASMVSNEMMEDLKRLGHKIIFVGDPAQLPPVKGSDKTWLNKFDYVLEEVVRQALESPIVRMSMDIRNGDYRGVNYTTDDCYEIDVRNMDSGLFTQYDQTICGTNIVRQKNNRFVRRQYGYESNLPVKGEKMICTQNKTQSGFGYINGIELTSLSDVAGDRFDPLSVIDIEYEGEERKDVNFYNYDCLSHYIKDIEKMPYWETQNLVKMDYAYCITCHKAQGSEWDKVIVVDDGFGSRDRELKKRWLYTAVTRAKEKLILLRK